MRRLIQSGSCQFPTLGFVVDRYFRVQRFVPEKFWTIRVTHTRDRKEVIFTWQRHRLFDRAATTIIYERCLTARGAKITKLQKHETSRWPPLPLTTVELQRLGSTFLHMDSQQVMKVGVPWRMWVETDSVLEPDRRRAIYQRIHQLPSN